MIRRVGGGSHGRALGRLLWRWAVGQVSGGSPTYTGYSRACTLAFSGGQTAGAGRPLARCSLGRRALGAGRAVAARWTGDVRSRSQGAGRATAGQMDTVVTAFAGFGV